MFFNVKPTKTIRYKLTGQLRGHTDSIHSLVMTESGILLASGGSDGVRLWDARALEECAYPAQNIAERGHPSCLVWADIHGETEQALCYGTILGYLIVWTRDSQGKDGYVETSAVRTGNDREIMCLMQDLADGRATWLLLGTRDQLVQVWKFEKGGSKPLLSVRLDKTVPKAVAFANNTKDIIMFGLFDGKVIVLRGSDGKVMHTHVIGSAIRDTAVTPWQSQYVVNNATDGFSMYNFETGSFIRKFLTGKPKKTYPKQVAFGEQSRIVVGGSDHGAVYVFERKTGRQLDMLHHANQGSVHTVSTHTSEGGIHLILGTTSAPRDDIFISIWRYNPAKPHEPSGLIKLWETVVTIFNTTLKLMVLAITFAYLYQNMDDTGKYWSYRYHRWIKTDNPWSLISDALDQLESCATRARADDARRVTPH